MGYYIDQLAEQDRQKRLAELLAMQQDNSEPGVSFDVPQQPMSPQGTLGDLMKSGASRDEINAMLSQSTMASPGFSGNTMSGTPYMPETINGEQYGMPTPGVRQAPENMIRNNSTGRMFFPVGMDGKPSQSQPVGLAADWSRPVDVMGKGGHWASDNSGRIILRDGSIVDPGRDTTAERARTKENLALDAQRATIAHTQAQTAGMSPAAAAEMERQKAMGKQQGEMAAAGAGAMPAGGATGTELLAALPAGIAEQVKAYAEGRRAFPPNSRSNPQLQQMMQLVAQYDPTFDQVDYNKRNKTATAFAVGPTADKVRNLNQSLIHAEKLSGNIEDLNNSDTLPGLVNPVSNFVGEKLGGQTSQNNFQQTVQALTSEMRKLFAAQGGGSLAELKKWEESFPLNAGKEQQKAYLKNGMELLSGGMSALENQYREGMGPKATMGSLLSPAALRSAQSFGLRDGGEAPTIAAGKGVVPPMAQWVAEAKAAPQNKGRSGAELEQYYMKTYGGK